MKIIKINSNDGYLNLPDLPHNCIFNKVITGCGGTTIALFNDENYVITVPTTELITNKTGLTSAGTAIIEKDGKQIEVFGLFGTLSHYDKKQLTAYLAKSGTKKIMCTYNKIIPLHKYFLSNPEDYRLLVDEYQVLLKSYGYREEEINGILTNFKKYKSYCFMSATPIDSEFKPDVLEEAEEVIAEWTNVETLHINLQETNNPYTKVINIINAYKTDGFITADGFKSYEAFFFINSVTDIAAILKHCELEPEEFKIICADNSDNRKKLEGYEIENSRTPNKRFTFITSKAFEGVDYFSETGMCFVVSNTSNPNTLLDIGTDIYQIAGRIRTKTNPFRDMIIHIYNTAGRRKMNLNMTYEDYLKDRQKQKKIAKAFIDFRNSYEEEDRQYADNINNNMYIYKDKDGNLSVDDLKIKLELFNFRIEQSIYKNGISIAKTYRENDMEPGEIQYEKLDEVIKNAAKKPEFKEIFLRYVDLKKQPFYLGDEIKYIERQFPLVKQSYNLLGEDKVRNLRYIQKDIRAAITNLDHTKNQNTKIALILKDGLSMGWHSLKSLKGHIASAYKAVGLKETAKGSDIEKYFDCKECFRRVNGKNTQGYEIYRSKIIFV